jgi:hypothetical protein
MSDWDRDAARRRDVRRSKAPSDTPRPRSSKDTKRWCRGKEGVEHQAKCVSYLESKNEPPPQPGSLDVRARWRTLLCAVCGRHLAYFWPFTTKEEPPAWVDK